MKHSNFRLISSPLSSWTFRICSDKRIFSLDAKEQMEHLNFLFFLWTTEKCLSKSGFDTVLYLQMWHSNDPAWTDTTCLSKSVRLSDWKSHFEHSLIFFFKFSVVFYTVFVTFEFGVEINSSSNVVLGKMDLRAVALGTSAESFGKNFRLNLVWLSFRHHHLSVVAKSDALQCQNQAKLRYQNAILTLAPCLETRLPEMGLRTRTSIDSTAQWK